ncbi:MarR family winged helix-turn-helix transcriptional regulator [Chitinophaga qingshengii]|uniref:HTH-type transcriptional regulator SarZ n=1 Tax=Chitinophaga qingshengii TaxID=1569794 RepID=A0ABR7TRZ2_9BACT|nr:MarR family transcriptional regulator [Chitinophaga qingshengii]MBC9933260.1 MarR family transcriptional regulator [Chitinophaga qingshengii]
MKQLKFSQHLCFPIYALSRLITSHYQPLLGELDLTYPQYLVMLLLWEHTSMNVKTLGETLMLDSGTLTPLLKRLEAKKLIKRVRSKEDERVVNIQLTAQGTALQQQAGEIPLRLADSLGITAAEAQELRDAITPLLYRLKPALRG